MRNLKRGFTLAEVMIVLTVIGVLTAILLPVARQSMPDENLMKFKKAHNTLGTVIRELVTSDKYYLDGDLGVRPNGDLIDGTHDGDVTYFCNTLADVLNVKKKNCSEDNTANQTFYHYVQIGADYDSIELACEKVDQICNHVQEYIGDEIVLNDKTVFFQSAPQVTFGISHQGSLVISDVPDHCTSFPGQTVEFCESIRQFGTHFKDNDGFPRVYRVFCIDIDGKDGEEEPFGYALRVDGKIMAGKRALEWLERDVNEE